MDPTPAPIPTTVTVVWKSQNEIAGHNGREAPICKELEDAYATFRYGPDAEVKPHVHTWYSRPFTLSKHQDWNANGAWKQGQINGATKCYYLASMAFVPTPHLAHPRSLRADQIYPNTPTVILVGPGREPNLISYTPLVRLQYEITDVSTVSMLGVTKNPGLAFLEMINVSAPASQTFQALGLFPAVETSIINMRTANPGSDVSVSFPTSSPNRTHTPRTTEPDAYSSIPSVTRSLPSPNQPSATSTKSLSGLDENMVKFVHRNLVLVYGEDTHKIRSPYTVTDAQVDSLRVRDRKQDTLLYPETPDHLALRQTLVTAVPRSKYNAEVKAAVTRYLGGYTHSFPVLVDTGPTRHPGVLEQPTPQSLYRYSETTPLTQQELYDVDITSDGAKPILVERQSVSQPLTDLRRTIQQPLNRLGVTSFQFEESESASNTNVYRLIPTEKEGLYAIKTAGTLTGDGKYTVRVHNTDSLRQPTSMAASEPQALPASRYAAPNSPSNSPPSQPRSEPLLNAASSLRSVAQKPPAGVPVQPSPSATSHEEGSIDRPYVLAISRGEPKKLFKYDPIGTLTETRNHPSGAWFSIQEVLQAFVKVNNEKLDEDTLVWLPQAEKFSVPLYHNVNPVVSAMFQFNIDLNDNRGSAMVWVIAVTSFENKNDKNIISGLRGCGKLSGDANTKNMAALMTSPPPSGSSVHETDLSSESEDNDLSLDTELVDGVMPGTNHDNASSSDTGETLY